jgi:hypothetical protein
MALEVLAMEERERRQHNAQAQELAKKLDEVARLIDAGQLDRAEILAADIQWQPDTSRSQLSDADQEMIKQYTTRREAVLAVIQRKRKPCPGAATAAPTK